MGSTYIQKLCDEAIQYHTASVCVPLCYIKRIHDAYGEKINICTVVGFPLGYSVTEAKVAEVRKALEDGCNEIDMVKEERSVSKWKKNRQLLSDGGREDQLCRTYHWICSIPGPGTLEALLFPGRGL